VILEGLDRKSRRRQQQPAMALVVAVDEDLHHRAVLADILERLVAELMVCDAQDELVHETRIVVESVLHGR
jgi:hypothetical protein